ncbi:hypothetical protein [uncultured Lamprocystis sp.]|jgi:uncharacterized protein YceK|uniref:hypothetical protein n=1 Tax=uncultured Lamprocystis sp. TaxID=543132 RepID=UPI0025F12196|nr:hypothetical protein [uncultured Lamprocystis sp.]
MKADKYGTIAAQIRYEAGWLPPTAADQRRRLPAQDPTAIPAADGCASCAHLTEPDLTAGRSASPTCARMSQLVTRRGSWCPRYAPIMDLHPALTPVTDAMMKAIQRRARLAGGQHD